MVRTIDAAGLAGLFRPGMTVFLSGAASQPVAVADALADNPKAAAGVTFITQFIPGTGPVDYAALDPAARMRVFFMVPELRQSFDEGRVDFVPMQYRAIYDHLANEVEVDLAILSVAPPGPDDRASLGVTVDFQPAVVDRARQVLCEFNAQMPAPADAPTLAPSRIDYALHVDRPLPVYETGPVGEAAAAIGRHVAGLIGDGDCIETGIGAIPSAVLAALGGKNDLGLHSGMIAEAARPLIEAGQITGAAKTVDRGRAVTGIALGDEDFYRWCGEATALSFRPVSHTHDVRVIGAIDNFVAINSAVEVDLLGQANAEMVLGRQVSGTGGAVDFMRGAMLSKGGRSIVALTATAAGGKVSRIVPALPTGHAATALRTDIDHVVTEFGVASIRTLPLDARAEALIAIAAPPFRDELRDAWRRLRKKM